MYVAAQQDGMARRYRIFIISAALTHQQRNPVVARVNRRTGLNQTGHCSGSGMVVTVALLVPPAIVSVTSNVPPKQPLTNMWLNIKTLPVTVLVPPVIVSPAWGPPVTVPWTVSSEPISLPNS